MTRPQLLIGLFVVAAFGCARPVGARSGGGAPATPYDRKLDEYGNIRWNDEKARLDNFAIELQNDPRAVGYLLCYGGRVGREGEARRRCSRAKGYLTAHRHIPAEQVVIVDGGHREELTVELWVIPPGMTPPASSPTVDPTEVQLIKGKAKRRARTKR